MRVLQYFNECIPLTKGVEPVKGCVYPKLVPDVSLNHGVRVKIIGFSATPDRSDKHKITSAFPVRVHTLHAKTLQTNRKYVAPASLQTSSQWLTLQVEQAVI
jgi:hypothetical protein